MASVDPVYAQWLQSEALGVLVQDGALVARWGDLAGLTKRTTTLASKADAVAEGARQLAFLGGPVVIEEHLMVGAWADYIGQVITVTAAQLGYEAGLDVFLISAKDDRAAGVSTILVIRRL